MRMKKFLAVLLCVCMHRWKADTSVVLNRGLVISRFAPASLASPSMFSQS